MSDERFDLVLVGGGSKILPVAMYAAKYAGLSVGIFECRHELGGCWSSEEAAVAGFISELHSSTVWKDLYFAPLWEDFPDWGEKGVKLGRHKIGTGMIMEEDDSCVALYHPEEDPNQERTARSIAQFSEKDAETYLKLWELNKPGGPLTDARIEGAFNVPPPPDQPDAFEKFMLWYLKQPDCMIDQRWLNLPSLQAAYEFWESPEMIRLTLSFAQVMGNVEAAIPALFIGIPHLANCYFVIGGTHNIAHAAHRIIIENGGKIFTNHPVSKILVKNGEAKGIRLEDGTEIAAKKAVVTGVSPDQLCFEMLESEHLSPKIRNKIKHLERRLACITWYSWALHEPPDYKAAAHTPDIKYTQRMTLGSKDPDLIIKEQAWRRLLKDPPETEIIVLGVHSQEDNTRSPDGKHVVGTSQTVLPANARTPEEWKEYKKSNAEYILSQWQKYAPNMTWDNVIGYCPTTPYDTASRMRNMWPTGNHHVVDDSPGQTNKFKPITEFARHRTPIKNLYATGAAWGPFAGAHTCQGYRCYKALAEDLGLDKPWEKKGRSY
ncbi:phytoene desaturase family protein [Thermodesulfobacteriota bacterium]